jgi:hypothetical protein
MTAKTSNGMNLRTSDSFRDSSVQTGRALVVTKSLRLNKSDLQLI